MSLDATGAAISGATVLLGADPRFGEPTLGTVTEDGALLLVANSPWAHFEDPAQPPDAADLPAPTVLRLSLR